MTRDEYLTALKHNLSPLTPQELEDVMEYFTEYFEEQDNDRQVIAELGSPAEAAQEILKNMGYQTTSSTSSAEETNHFSGFSTFFQEIFEKSFKENFFKNFKSTAYEFKPKETIEIGPFLLEDLERVQLDLTDENMTIRKTNAKEAQLRFKSLRVISEKLFHFDQGNLHLSSEHTEDIEKIILELPKSHSLIGIHGQLEDVNLRLEEIRIEHFHIKASDTNFSMGNLKTGDGQVYLQDCNLSVESCQFSQLKLEAEDSNLTLQSSDFDRLTITLEDGQFSSHDNHTHELLHVKAEDSHISHQIDRQHPSHYRISAENSIVNLPDDLDGQMQKVGTSLFFETDLTSSPSQVNITCEDAFLTLS